VNDGKYYKCANHKGEDNGGYADKPHFHSADAAALYYAHKWLMI
jgi:hypothetical protein